MPRGLVVLVLLLVLGGAVWAAVHRDPWDPDETRYLEVAHEMNAAGGSPFFLRFNGKPYTDKPPLFFWFLAPAVAWLGATSALAGALPSILALLGLAWATVRLGRRAGLDPPVARWGALLTVSSLLPALLAGGCRMDLLFAVSCVLALDRIVALAGTHPHRSDHLMLWLWIALGVLTKGPLAIVLPLLAALLLLPGSSSTLRRALAGWGPLLALAILALWLVPAAVIGGREWVEAVVIHQSAGRVVSSFAHREPWWYHLAVLPLTLLPWSFAVLMGILRALSQRHALPERARLLPAYAVATLGFLTLLSGKTFLYPLPLFAPAGLVAAWWILRRPDSAGPRLTVAGGGFAVAVVGVGLAVVASHRRDMSLSHLEAAVLAASLAVPGLLAVLAAARARMRLALGALVLAVPLFAAFGVQTLVPRFNTLLSLRPFGVAYRAAAPPDVHGAAFERIQPGYVLFTGRFFDELQSAGELRAALEAGRVVAADDAAAERVAAEEQVDFRVLVRVPYRHSTILLLDRPPSRAPSPDRPL